MESSSQDDGVLLSEADRTRVEESVEAVLRADQPQEHLFQLMVAADAEGKPPIVVALFDALFCQLAIDHYWVLYQAMLGFQQLRRFDSAYMVACLANRIDPASSGALLVNQIIFNHALRSGMKQQAMAVFDRYMAIRPEAPFISADEIRPLMQELRGVAAMPGAERGASAGRSDIRVVESSIRPACPTVIYGRFVPPMFRVLADIGYRAAIDVVHLEGGEVLIQDDAIVVLSRGGQIQDDISIHEFPSTFVRAFNSLPEGRVSELSLDTAVLLSDRFPINNVAHTLYDHVTRMELYAKAGVDLATATVIGPAARTKYQTRLYGLFGIDNLLSTDRVARLRVRDLYVSTNCKALSHPAHEGIAWALDGVRARLGGASQPGKRSLYISRRDAGVRRLVNEDKVAALLQRHGFETLALGELPYDEQVAAFADAKQVVGMHGAGMTHVALCAPGTPVLEMFHPLATPSGIALLAHGAQLDYSALVGFDGHEDHPQFNETESLDGAVSYLNRDVRVDLADIERWLRRAA